MVVVTNVVVLNVVVVTGEGLVTTTPGPAGLMVAASKRSRNGEKMIVKQN